MPTPHFIGSYPDRRSMPEPDRPEAAFAGRSNVGKSSAINRLLGHRTLMRVSGKPGATRLLNVVDWGELRLVDLPGYGYARVSKTERARWGVMVGEYLEGRESLRLLVLIVDIRHEPKETDQQLLGWARARGVPVLVLMTKADKLSRNKGMTRARAVRKALALGAEDALVFSAKTGQGRDELAARLDALKG